MSTEAQIERTSSTIQYWNTQWENMTIGFHQNNLHPMLVKHIQLLTENRENLRIFFPLCGKAWDMRWLASLGHQIVGIESNQKALEQFYQEGNLKYTIEEKDDLKIYISEDNRIRLYLGDFFKLTPTYEQPIDCVWDRGSLVALPENLRDKYVEHIFKLLSPNFRYLLDTFWYNREWYPGPPHTIDLNEIKRLYGDKCSVDFVDSEVYRAFNEKLKEDPPKEMVYLLKPLN